MSITILVGDCRARLAELPEQSVQTCVTSPPYFGLRDYGHDGQIGLEQTPDAFVTELVSVFREVRRVLRDDGTLWLNLGDSYGQGKQLLGIPWRVAFALQADGWYLRQDIIWHKPNPMPESVKDRCTKAHEYIFLLSKSERYFYDADAVAEQALTPGSTHVHVGGAGTKAEEKANDKLFATRPKKTWVTADTRNRRSVWTVATAPFSGAHFATFPPALIEPCILAGCPPRGKRCDCDDIIATPTGSGAVDDPTRYTGRAGMNRPRREDEGVRPVTRRQQRHNAAELRESPHRAEMETEAGSAFAHYIRTDLSGARPIPPHLFNAWLGREWITYATPCDCPEQEAGTVLDPFGGAGTTGLVANRHGRHAILCELNPTYAEMAAERIYDDSPMFAEVTVK